MLIFGFRCIMYARVDKLNIEMFVQPVNKIGESTEIHEYVGKYCSVQGINERDCWHKLF